MTDEELAKVALPEAGTRRQAVEAFVKWTRDVEDQSEANFHMTLEQRLCSCAAPGIDGVASGRRHDCPWCTLRSAFGLLEGA